MQWKSAATCMHFTYNTQLELGGTICPVRWQIDVRDRACPTEHSQLSLSSLLDPLFTLHECPAPSFHHGFMTPFSRHKTKSRVAILRIHQYGAGVWRNWAYWYLVDAGVVRLVMQRLVKMIMRYFRLETEEVEELHQFKCCARLRVTVSCRVPAGTE